MNKTVFEIGLSQIMRQNQEDTARPRTRSGMLDTHRIPFYKVTDKIFKKRKQAKKGKNYFISILMDASGSMKHAGRVKPCLKAVQKLSESLIKVPGIHFEIVGFNGIQIKYKDYNEAYDGKKLAEEYFQQCCVNELGEPQYGMIHVVYTVKSGLGMDLRIRLRQQYDQDLTQFGTNATFISSDAVNSENHDGLAVWDSFLRSKERDGKKILFVFSDGAPTFESPIAEEIQRIATNKSNVVSINGDKKLIRFIKDNPDKLRYNIADSLLTQVLKQSKRNEIDTVGIGIQCDEVGRFYDHWGVVNNTEDIYPETIRQLTKLFRKE